ncbi:hypothetical protein MTR67_018315 [Solanum verrucosum]|uniref:Isopentenyltransferase n=1 Tax=Solanum verrucosum TaxID=315347 RepID=A0AAF0QPI9_SOLVR|nr:hypothetical protein MTR67_018315 [Solanum verrucosum]
MRVDQMVNEAKINTFINNNKFNKKKVVFIMGAIGTGKSRLSVDLTTHFRGEIINSDKIQVYKGLEIVTNKITHTEKQGVRRYLLAKMNNFINNNKFNKKKVVFIMGATRMGKSHLFIDLVSDFRGEIINSDKMLVYKRLEIITNKITNIEKQGLVDEVLHVFIPDGDYTKRIRWSIGVPEIERYLREETNIDEDNESKKMILKSPIANIKRNTRLLI